MNYYIELLAKEKGISLEKAKLSFLGQTPQWRRDFIISHVPDLHSLDGASRIISA